MTNSNEEYIQKCAEQMLLRYGKQIRIRITKPVDSSLHPKGAWFDQHIGEIMEPAGIDLSATPKLYVMQNGETVPFSCAMVIEKGIFKIGDYYMQFRWDKPYRVVPEDGSNMWQVSLGFVTITRMK